MLASRPTTFSLSLFVAITFVFVFAGGCASTSGGGSLDHPGAHHDAAERLWRRKCVECHGLHAPSRMSDAGWARTLDDMAVEARLTDEEKAAILDYLQESNGRP